MFLGQGRPFHNVAHIWSTAMLFADVDWGFFILIWIVIFVVGTRKICQILKGNDAARGLAKKGALSLLSHLFKK
jgi:hypothetical protein